MSIKHGILALLCGQPGYGYQLRSELDKLTGSTWPVNIGQIYTTLRRLERDGLVTNTGDDAEGHVVYEIKASGVEEVSAWFNQPITAADRPRNELALKLAFAVTVAGDDVAALVEQQRSQAERALQELNLRKLQAGAPHHSSTLVLEAQIIQTEAEICWLAYVADKVSASCMSSVDSTIAIAEDQD